MTDPTRPPTVEELRDDIDSGRTGDKVNYPDPAAVPIGADAEAGGYPPTTQELEQIDAAAAIKSSAPPGRNWTGIVIFVSVAACIFIAMAIAMMSI
jgi:hypothetical protein